MISIEIESALSSNSVGSLDSSPCSQSNDDDLAPPHINDKPPRKKSNLKELVHYLDNEEKKFGADDSADSSDTVSN